MLRFSCLGHYISIIILSSSFAATAKDEIRLHVGSPVEVVYSYARQRCDWRMIPDSPARALRRDDGTIALIAGHFRNRVLAGPTFDALRPVCDTVSGGAESGDSRAVDDRFWIQALAPLPDGRVLGLASHEYMGSRHPGACALATSRRPACWYFSIVSATARQDDLTFRLLPRERRVVAAPSRPYDPRGDTTGFLTTSNIVFSGEHAFFLSWTQDSAVPGGRGHCLFRAPKTDLLGGWEVLRDGRYGPLGDPDRGGETGCDRVGGESLFGKVRSVVRIEERGIWLAVFATRRVGRPDEPPFGVYTATSRDLVTWSDARHLASFEPFWGASGCGVFYEYPSLIDHGSRSPVFDTAGGDLFLYMTRLNWERCDAVKMDRDLVRVRLRLDGS